MNCIDALSVEDLKKIDAYRFSYSGANRGVAADIKTILRYWNRDKQQLFKRFGEKLIIEKPVEYKESVETISNKLWRLYDCDIHFYQFYKKINAHCWYEIQDLAKNAMGTDEEITLPDGKVFKIVKGMKPMKVARKLAKAYHFETIECDDGDTYTIDDFCIAHSQCLNQKVLKGDLCISIHPLDYMTMSDNASDWSSCMSWENNGDYRLGTVEMMNSSYVVVAYLKGKEDYKFFDYSGNTYFEYSWNNKKWRSLFVVTDDFITSVKPYPYESEDLSKAAMRLIAETIGWGDDSKIYPFVGGEENQYDGFNTAIHFQTGAMYNDFGCAKHYICFDPNIKTQEDISPYMDYDYSGVTECMECGNEYYDWSDRCDMLVCDDCQPITYCECCGDRIYDCNDLYDIAGVGTLCYYCYEERLTTCQISGEQTCYATDVGIKGSNDVIQEWFVCKDYLWGENPNLWAKYFTADPSFNSWRNYYISEENVKPEYYELMAEQNQSI